MCVRISTYFQLLPNITKYGIYNTRPIISNFFVMLLAVCNIFAGSLNSNKIKKYCFYICYIF